MSFLGYRDIKDKKRFEIKDFTDDFDSLENFISGINAEGGDDVPEDIAGALNQALNLSWRKNSAKFCILIADAPCHGKKYTNKDYDDINNIMEEGISGFQEIAKSTNNENIQNLVDEKLKELKTEITTSLQQKQKEYNEQMDKTIRNSERPNKMNIEERKLNKELLEKAKAYFNQKYKLSY